MARVDVRGNLGPGIAAAADIDIRGIEARYNQGPGIQSLFGSITIAPGGGPDEEGIFITNNEGPGIFTGANTLFDPGEIESGNEEISPQSIIIKTAIQVSGNGGWGIFAEENGDVFINVDPDDRTVSLFQVESVISENGNPNHGCLFLDDAGGVGAGQGRVFAALVDISSNNGPGIATGGNVNIREGSVCGNTTDVLRGGEANLENVTVCKESSIIELPGEAATASTTADEKPEPAPNADASVQPDGDTPQEGAVGLSSPQTILPACAKAGAATPFRRA